jgi:hypothetical protein
MQIIWGCISIHPKQAAACLNEASSRRTVTLVVWVAVHHGRGPNPIRQKRKEMTMNAKVVLWSLLLTSSIPAAQSQVLTGDAQFSALHDIGWGMSISEIRSLYEKNQKLMSTTDSSLILNTEFFGVPAPTEIRFRQNKGGAAFIHIKFSEPTKALVDTISNHFTRFTQKAPEISATEKKLFILSLRMEMAKWKTEKESIVLTTALRDGTIGDVGLIISSVAN